MCSNFQAITARQRAWVREQFQCELPMQEWREDIYPGYQAPFIWRDGDQIRCDLAGFGLVPGWAINKPRFFTHTYNARSETVTEKASFKNAWRQSRFGLAIMQSFYEPNYQTGKAVRWRIKRPDDQPLAVASIWERVIDRQTGEIHFTFSMLTVNAIHHPVMKQFHGMEDEKRSIVVLTEADYLPWLHANASVAKEFLRLPSNELLTAEPAPRVKSK